MSNEPHMHDVTRTEVCPQGWVSCSFNADEVQRDQNMWSDEVGLVFYDVDFEHSFVHRLLLAKRLKQQKWTSISWHYTFQKRPPMGLYHTSRMATSVLSNFR